jgi:hypothetical protein
MTSQLATQQPHNLAQPGSNYDVYYSAVDKNVAFYQNSANGYRPANGSVATDGQWLKHQNYSCWENCETYRYCDMLSCPLDRDDCRSECGRRCDYSSFPAVQESRRLGPNVGAVAVDWRGREVFYPKLPIPGLRWNEPLAAAAPSVQTHAHPSLSSSSSSS